VPTNPQRFKNNGILTQVFVFAVFSERPLK